MLFQSDLHSSSPVILIRFSEKCWSNCLYCDRPNISKNTYLPFKDFEKILLQLSIYFDKKFHIWILWSDIFLHPKFWSIYTALNASKFHAIIQIWLEDLNKYRDQIIYYSQQNTWFWIQLILSNRNLKDVARAINIIKNIPVKITVNLILDFKVFEPFIELLKSKFKFQIQGDVVNIYIWESIIEIEPDIWFSNIKEFGFSECIAKKNFSLSEENLIIENDVEILLNGDIKFHLNNFCNQWIKKISNIFKEEKTIYQDFEKLSVILNKKIIGESMCLNCLKWPINI